MTRRLLAIIAAAALAATGLALVAAAPASAQPREGLTVVRGEVAERSYPPIPGNYPVAPTVNWTPGGCNDAAIGNVCDTVPLKVIVPELGPVDDFYVTIEVSWDDPEDINDVDVYLWDDEQTREANGQTGWTRLNQSASSANPEIIRQFDPRLGDYNLTVVNWAGPNLGYTVKAFITVVEFDAPFELLAPEFTTPQDTSGEGETASQPFDYSAVDPASPSAPIAPTFGELPVQPDATLDFGPSDFDRSIAAPPAITPRSQLTRRPPRPVPGAVAAFWFGAVPLVLVGAAVLLLARRRRDAFAYA